MPSGTPASLGAMWDVLTWHSGTLVLAVVLISAASKSHR
jgi:hypothetical protein